MMKRYYYSGLFILAAFSVRISAVNMAFNESGSISDGETYYSVSVYNDDTVVSVLGGSIEGDFNLYDSSSAEFYGGTIGMDINAFDRSCVELFDVAIIDDVYLYETSQLKFHNGFVGDNLQLYDSTEGWLFGGTVLGNLGVHDSSVVSILGGNTEYLLWADGASNVNIYGYNLNLTSSGGSLGYGRITGRWQDNTGFTIHLDTADTYMHINLYEIPEPCTLLLLAFGGLALQFKQK